MKKEFSQKGSFGGVIRIRGARVHNLKNIDLDIPKGKFIVITGLSGSGKSSLAFDTIYAEAERRYVESLSSYARQFLGVKDKPDVESIEGLSPAISIDQKSISKNPRSTVGTITEIYDYFRILFARVGRPHCPNCGKPVKKQSVDHIVASISKFPKKTEVAILAPLVRGKKGEHRSVVEEVKTAGFLRIRFDGELMRIDDLLARAIDKKRKHSLEVVVDRFSPGADIERARIRDSVETALKIGKGNMLACAVVPGKKDVEDTLFSQFFACTDCGVNLPEIEPRTFSFNSPYGACPACTGLGSVLEVQPELVIPNKRLTVAEGAIRPWASASHRLGRQSWYWWILDDLAARYKFSLNTPLEKLSPKIIDVILNGERGADVFDEGEEKRENAFEGVIPNLKRRWKDTDSDFTRAEIEKYMVIKVCESCNGKRLRPEALGVKIGDENIASVSDRTVEKAEEYFREIGANKQGTLGSSEFQVALPLIREISKRLTFLKDVGLEYLTLSRESTTLAGGEAQRIKLATQIGSRLTGIIYILDEPSIAHHARDHARLIQTLKNLRDIGNTIIVVEHDAETMREADWIIDLGPGAGKHGGTVIFEGTAKEIFKARTLTGEYLSGKKEIDFSKKFPADSGAKEKYIVIKGAKEHNLKNIDVKIPLGKFVCVSGVSGSGKSTLINDILSRALLAKFYGAHVIPGEHGEIIGADQTNKIVVVDQSPIGRTPRSNPATYTGTFGLIRGVFASTFDARSRGYGPGRFSFNVKGGRCEACEGQGVKKIEMYFLPDVYVECEECRGKRYNREALDIEYNGKNIADVLDMTVEDAREFFLRVPGIKAKLDTLWEVGLGYVKLGQPAPTLSGGEAQRTKLATELSRRDTGTTLYILDEPTTGLHFDDIAKLLKVLHSLVEKGNTVLVIEHNLDVLRNAHWIIDLGPEGGDKGGEIVAEGTPADITRVKNSYTGQWLKKR